MTFLKELSSPTVLRFAWEHVAAKGGVPGIDRVTIAEFGAELEKNIRTLSHEIETKSYRALPVLRIRPSFLAASDRALVVPTVRDRVVQRAIAELLAPQIEPTLSPACRAFRKGFSAVSTAADVGRAIEGGLAWVLRADVRGFFDGIRPELLREMLDPFVDEEGLRFLDRILRCRIFDHHQVMSSPAGILALLRARGLPDADAVRRRLAEKRWRLSTDAPPRLALELAKAWSAAGYEEQSWLEMATACSGSRSDLPRIEEWAQVLDVEAPALSEIAGRLVGLAEERLAVLTEAIAELGRYKLASRLDAAAAAYAAPAIEVSEPSGTRDLATEADIHLLLEWFQGREGVHATEALNRAGHRSFVPIHRPIMAEDWTAHLAGERALALPLVRSGNDAFLGVLDVDVERQALDQRLGVPDDLLGRALGTARRLRKELRQRGCSSLLELSGYKGYHVWIRLADPVPCFRLRRWLLDVVRSIEPLPEGIRVEEFPNRDRVSPGEVGPLVKLPLGVHSKTGKRCALLDDAGNALADPFEAIRSLPRTPGRMISEPPVSPRQEGQSVEEIGPRARRMLEGCHVLAYLAKRARDTSYLDHRERSTLLCTLGHLGEEGNAALHAIISKTYNYSRDTTDRHIARLPPWPISCPKVRELHPQALESGSCKCQFDIRGKGYPTPLLYALRASEVPVFRQMKPRFKGASPAKEEPRVSRPTVKEQELHKEVEEKIRKIAELKRQRRKVDAAIDRINEEISALFDRGDTETLQLSMGLLKRVRRSDGEGWEFVIEV